MAGCADLFYFRKDGVVIAVQSKRLYKLEMTGGKTFGPEFVAASAPVGHLAGFECGVKGFFVHVCEHQNFICLIVLSNDRYLSVAV